MNVFISLGALASGPQALDFALRFARTIILARLLLPTEFGISVSIAVVVTIANLVSDMGLDSFVITHPPGNDRDVLAAAHGLQIVRGVVLAAAIVVAAPWIAWVMGAPGQAASFRWCGAIALIHAFVHLEITQLQRNFRYGQQGTAIILARVAAFASVYPAAQWFGDHRVMILSLLLDAAVYVAATHLLAKSRYRIVPSDRATLRRALAYGLPLTLNGIGIALNSQFDRVVISHWLGLELLALYSVIVNLALVPISLISPALGLLGLSFLTRARDHVGSHQDSYVVLIWVHAVVAAAYAVFVAATLDVLAPLVFGHEYGVSPWVQLLITLRAWLRISRGAPTGQMLFDGDTRRLTIANLIGASGLVPAALLLSVIPRIETVLVCLAFGEGLSLAVFLWGVRGRTSARREVVRVHLFWSFAVAALSSCGVLFYSPGAPWSRAALICVPMLVMGTQAVFGFRRYLARDGLLRSLIETKE